VIEKSGWYDKEGNMINRTVVSELRSSAIILTYTDIRSYVFTFVFVALAVLVPWGFHQYHLAGPTFLPMHIFVLAAGLVFGWRAGLIVGALTPLVSYSVSGMPVLTILPQILVEISTYGLVAGLLREKLNLSVVWSLLGAMLAGRLALCLTVSAIYLVAGEIYSPLGLESNPLTAVWSTIKQGWPGIIIQLALIPLSLWLVAKWRLKVSRSRP
jgi:uncharacterized membrane protein